MTGAFQNANDAIFNDGNIGELATYTTPGNVSSIVRVVRKAPEETFGIEGQGYSDQVVFEVRSSDIELPETGAKLLVNGKEFLVKVWRADEHALVWALDVEPIT